MGEASGGTGQGERRTAQRIGVGCFSAFAGFWSGGMVAVLVGRVVEAVRGSPKCEGIPICNWYVYAGVGAAIGFVSLPVLVLWRLRQSTADTEKSERG
jgi:hypothetical protein